MMVKVMLTLVVDVEIVDTSTGTLGGAGPATEKSYECIQRHRIPLTVIVVLAVGTVLSWATVALH